MIDFSRDDEFTMTGADTTFTSQSSDPVVESVTDFSNHSYNNNNPSEYAYVEPESYKSPEPLVKPQETYSTPVDVPSATPIQEPEPVYTTDYTSQEVAPESDPEPVVAASPELNSEEDALLAQIDAFRDKAKELSELIAAKESKINSLEAANAKQAAELAEASNSDAAVVSVNLDEDINKIIAKLDDIQRSLTTSVDNSEETLALQIRTVKQSIDTLTINSAAESTDADMGGIKTEISDKIHSENVKLYRNIQDLLKEQNTNPAEELEKADMYQLVKKAKKSAGAANLFAVLAFITSLALLAFKLMEMGLLVLPF